MAAYGAFSRNDCPRWIEFIEDIVPEEIVRIQLQQFFGYCLTQESRYQKALLLQGDGSNGKDVIIRILRELVGPVRVCDASPADLSSHFVRAGLYGKSLVVLRDGGRRLCSTLVKAIVTGDVINAGFKHRAFFTFQPRAKMVFVSNGSSAIGGSSAGYRRRVLVVRLIKQFGPGLDAEADPFLVDKLRGELEGILRWAMLGLELLEDLGGFVEGGEQ